ncbi:hypothetical protein KVP81_22435, partial [Escherichia coli]|nr:hypothetical protein [Escherichia coli]
QKQKKLIMLPSETMIWQPEFTDKTLSRKPGAVHTGTDTIYFVTVRLHMHNSTYSSIFCFSMSVLLSRRRVSGDLTCR